MRLDQALARLFGLSRTAATAIIDAGEVTLDGTATAKSDRVIGGGWLEVTLPAPPAPPMIEVETIEGLRVVYADSDLVVVDKPVGVAAHPSPGWTGPTVIGG